MATINGSTVYVSGPNYDNAITALTLAALLNANPTVTTSTTYELDNVIGGLNGIAANYANLVFTGTGFIYQTAVPVSGTISAMTQKIWDGTGSYKNGMTWAGLNVSWATFWADMTAAQTTGDLAPINNLFFGGNDTFTMGVMASKFSGFGGDDVFNYGSRLGQVGVDGGTGNDTLNLDGDYGSVSGSTVSLRQSLAAGMIVSIEKITMTGAHSYAFQWNNGAATGVSKMPIDASSVTGVVAFDASRESTVSFSLISGTGSDNLITGAAVDTLTGGAGNDTLDGGANVDTAVFSGNRASYTITQNSTGNFTVTGPDGTDALANIEYAKFDDQTMRLLPGTGTTVTWSDPSTYMAAIRDFDGNDLGGAASWKLIGTADVNGDGSAEHILFNKQIGRWAEVGTEADGKTYFSNNGWAGDTRVVGIYIDPLVANGTVVKGSDTDSQRRFQNDLQIDNIKSILGFGDYNHDGLQEVYFSLTDGTAYLHAYMHADGNIQYANYQNKQQVIDYLTNNGVAPSTWATWFPVSQAAPDMMSAMTAPGSSATMLASSG